MKTDLRWRLSGAAAALGLTLSLPALADDAGERVLVVGRSGDTATLAPNSASLLRLRPEDGIAPTRNLSQLIGRVPGLAETGEGGLFQVYSVRGLSGQRVRTLLEDVPILSERAAGNAGSFLDPLLLGYADVLRGPSSTFLGSGALGGGVVTSLRQFARDTVELGGWSGSGERYGLLAGGSGELSAAFSVRSKDNGESPDGEPINDHFRQGNASVKGRLRFDGGEWQYYALAAEGRDIGRANKDYPAPRQVDQKEDRHYIAGSRLLLDSGDSFKLYVHPNGNERDTLTVGKSVNTVSASSRDGGAEWSRAWEAGEASGHAGVEWFARRDVEVDECVRDLNAGRRDCVAALDAELEQWSGLADAHWQLGDWLLEAGGRYTRERQRGPEGAGGDQAGSGFLGLVRELPGGWRVNANAGTAFRFPSLTEKWFSGTTARGGVVGNPALDPERSRSAEVGAIWQGERSYAHVQLFRQGVRDYIERVPLAGDIRSYRNLDDGRIRGLEFSGAWEPAADWRLAWHGQRLRGEGDDGETLTEIPADRVGLDLAYAGDDWSAALGLTHRFRKSEAAATEREIGRAELVDARLEWQPAAGWTLSLFGENLGNESYYTSADVAEVRAEERRIGLSARYALP